METLDPLDARLVQLMQSARIPTGHGNGLEVNRYRTRPTANGLANEDFRDSAESFGHHIEVFRVGHCEYFCELGRSVNQITKSAQQENPKFKGLRVVRYTDIAQVIEFGAAWLWRVWHSVLPYTYMTLTVRLMNTANTTLFSRDKLFGHPTTAGSIEYSEIVQKQRDVGTVEFRALERVAHSYGLVLPGVRDAAGQHVRPEKMS